MKNQLIQKFEEYLAKLHEEGTDSGWIREAILELQRLEDLLLEERMKCEAYEIALNHKCNPAVGKREAREKKVKELLKTMGIK